MNFCFLLCSFDEFDRQLMGSAKKDEREKKTKCGRTDRHILAGWLLACAVERKKMNCHVAAEKGNLDRVKLLLDQGADKDKFDGNGNTPLRLASAFGHFDVVQYLVEQGASLDKDSINYTPLAIAANQGHLEIARYLLEQGADRDKANKSGRTPLHNAATQGHLEITVLLMSYGADLNAKDKDGRLSIDIARTEEIKQAIRDEPRRRMDEAPGKRAIEQDRQLNTATSASAQQEDDDDEEVEEEQSNNLTIFRMHLKEGAVAVKMEATKVASEDEDSEPSSDEEEDDNTRGKN